jgi:molybdate transport system substrate-binding protein
VRRVAPLLLALAFAAACSREPAKTGANALRVMAAVSLTDALNEAARAFESERHVAVRCEFGASSLLARQIVADAPCDLFVSADVDWMDYLEKRDRVETASRRDVASNQLVLIAPKARPFQFDCNGGKPLAEAFAGRLALGDPAHVPAGIYAKAALEKMGAWTALESRVVAAVDVRAALKLVERGEADAGVVYVTDARSSKEAVVVATIPVEWHAPIRYPAAATKGAPPAAAEFVRWLADEPGQAILARFGFAPPSRP